MSVITSLVAYWSLDEASGDAIDAHGANDMTDTGTVGAASGKVSGARDFERDNGEYFVIADNADLSTGDIDFSIAVWVNIESTGIGSTIFAKWIGSGREWVLELDESVGNKFSLVVYSGASFGSVTATTFGSVSTGTWYFVTAWHDSVNNQLGIAVNAGSADTAAWSNGVQDGTSDIYIAGDITTTRWDGLIDELGFWKKVLTSGERTWLYNSGAGRSYTDIVNEAGAGAKAKVMFGRALRFFTRRY